MVKKWRSAALHVILFLFVAVSFIAVYIRAGIVRTRYDKVELSKGWTVKLTRAGEQNIEILEDVDLDEYHVKGLVRGDWFVLSTTLPEELPERPSLRIRSAYSVVDVYVDSQKIFSCGYEEYNNGYLTGSGNRFIALPDDCAGKTLKITVFIAEENAFSTINPPVISDGTHEIVDYLTERQLPLAVALSLITAGFAITVVTFCMYFKSFSIERLFCIGVFSLCIGSWSLCSYDLNLLFTERLYLKSYLEYMSLYLSPLPLILYFREDVERRERKWEIRIYFAVVLCLIQLFVVAVLLNFMNIAHFPVLFGPYLAIILAVVCYAAFLIVRDAVGEKKHRLLIWGVVALLAFSLRDIIVYAFVRFSKIAGTQGEYRTYTAAGAFVFIMAMFADFINEYRRTVSVEAENRLLVKLAYNDVLTGLNTRRRIEEIFKEIDEEGKNFAIMQFDLNNLKQVNDNFGHEKGDELIVNFSDCLKKVYCNGESIGRMGGDEFVVIVPDSANYKVDATVAALEILVSKVNDMTETTKISYSCGFCYSDELEHPTAARVYVEADRRMYLEKEKYYKEKGYGRRRSD